MSRAPLICRPIVHLTGGFAAPSGGPDVFCLPTLNALDASGECALRRLVIALIASVTRGVFRRLIGISRRLQISRSSPALANGPDVLVSECVHVFLLLLCPPVVVRQLLYVRVRPLRRNEFDVAPAQRTMMFPAVSSNVWVSGSLSRASTRRKKQSKSSGSLWRACSHSAHREFKGCSFLRYFSVVAMREETLFGLGFGMKTGVSAPHSGATRCRSSGSRSCL